MIASAAALVVLVIVGIVLATRSGDESAPTLTGTATAGAGAGAGATGGAAAAADPMKDAGAWRALPEADRAARSQRYLADLEKAPPRSLAAAAGFLVDRGESAAAATVARRAIGADTECAWARAALGYVDVHDLVERCLGECEFADEVGTDEVEALKALRGTLTQGRRSLWADGDAAARVTQRVEDVRRAEEKLKDPYWYGVAKWARLQRATHVMRDYPSLHAAVGPHVIFVAVDVPKGTQLADAPPDKVAEAQKVLDRQVKLFTAFYDGWMQEIGTRLGLTRYGPENADFDTLCKMQVFANEAAYEEYNAEIGAGALFARAYYSLEEPRFITTYEGGEDEDDAETDQIQCHEGTHQLVHFYTWDTSRKALGRKVEWLDCLHSPMWSNEGFAEFFSSHKVVDGRYVWMQPLVERLKQIWMFDDLLAKKQWAPWKLREILSTRHSGEAEAIAGARAKPEDEGIAIGVMVNLYYAKAWSLVHFLWYAEEGGKPKWRDRYLEYLKFEYLLRYATDSRGTEYDTIAVQPADFRRILGLSDDADFAAFEKEWREFEARLVAAHEEPDWTAEKAEIFEKLGLK